MVSTPARDAAASRVARRGIGGWLARGGGHLGVLLGLAGWVGFGRATKNPSCHRHGGVSASVGTDALGDYEAARAVDGRQAWGTRTLCASPGGGVNQPVPPVDTGVHFVRDAGRRSSEAGVELLEPAAQVGQRDRAGRAGSPAGSGSPCPAGRRAARGLDALGDDVHAEGAAQLDDAGHQRGAARVAARSRPRTRGPSSGRRPAAGPGRPARSSRGRSRPARSRSPCRAASPGRSPGGPGRRA